MGLIRRVTGARILRPLRHRDFALLTTGSVVSLVGDGFFHVALAWQVYEISNLPTALSFVGVAATLPLVLFVLIGGAFSDRYDRRLRQLNLDLFTSAVVQFVDISAKDHPGQAPAVGAFQGAVTCPPQKSGLTHRFTVSVPMAYTWLPLQLYVRSLSSRQRRS